MFKTPIGTVCHTGQTCPESGVWKAIGYMETIPLAKGNTFPPYNRQAVSWQLIQYA